MSVRIMTAAWAVDLPAGEKLVLLALADCANDEGHCWPGLANLARKTGKSRRSLIDTIHALEKAEHISRDVRIGKGVNYTIHPQASEQLALPIGGAKAAPVQKPHQCKKAYGSGAKSAPKPSGTVITKKDKPSSRARAKPKQSLPEDWEPKPLTPGSVCAQIIVAWQPGRIERELSKFRNHHIAHGNLMSNWQAAWCKWIGNADDFAPRKPNPQPHAGGDELLDALDRARAEEAAERQAQTDHPGGWGQVPPQLARHAGYA